MNRFAPRDLVALLLALALVIVVVGATISIVYATVVNEFRLLGDAATQLLTALFGGIIAILGGYVGAGARADDPERYERGFDDDDAEPPESFRQRFPSE